MTHIINPTICDRTKQIVKGTILGGSSIVQSNGGKNYYLSMRSKNGKWIDYKASELAIFSSKEPITIEKTNRWHSLCYPYFSEIKTMFYENKKREIQMSALDDLKDVGYMIWFGDSGSYKNGRIIFNTHIWGEDGTQKINEYLHLSSFDSEIFLERKNFRIRLSEKSSKSLMTLMAPQFPYWFTF